jgi:hypothetical protein
MHCTASKAAVASGTGQPAVASVSMKDHEHIPAGGAERVVGKPLVRHVVRCPARVWCAESAGGRGSPPPAATTDTAAAAAEENMNGRKEERVIRDEGREGSFRSSKEGRTGSVAGPWR